MFFMLLTVAKKRKSPIGAASD